MSDKGEATIVLAVAGAWATAAPFVVAMVDSNDLGDGVLYVGALAVAITAVGVLFGKVWRLLRAAAHKLDQIEDLVIRAERMELRQLATSDQLRNLSERFDVEHPRP